MSSAIKSAVQTALLSEVKPSAVCPRCCSSHTAYVRGRITFVDCKGIPTIVSWKAWGMR